MDQSHEETIAGRNDRLNRQAEDLRQSVGRTDAEEIAANEFMKRKDEALLTGVPVPETLIETDAVQFLHMCANSKYLLLRNSAWASILGSAAMCAHLNPITVHAKVLDGHLGDIDGCEIYTDAFMNPMLRTEEIVFKNTIVFSGKRESNE